MTARRDLPLGAFVLPVESQDRYSLAPKKRSRLRRILPLLIVGSGLLLLVSILGTSMCGSREQGNRIRCVNNLRQIGLAAIMYANTNGGAFPASLENLDASELGSSVFCCPSDRSSDDDHAQAGLKPGLSYFYVGDRVRVDVDHPETAVIAYEPLSNHANDGMKVHLEAIADHRRDGMNVLFADGHGEFVTASDAGPIFRPAAAGTRPIRFGNDATTQP